MRATIVMLALVPSAAAVAAVGTQAFYILFADQIVSPMWPSKVCQNGGVGPQGDECVDARKYENGTFIASPQNMTADLIAQVKRDVPGSSVLAYFDFGAVSAASQRAHRFKAVLRSEISGSAF